MIELAIPFALNNFALNNFTGCDLKRESFPKEVVQIESPISITPSPYDLLRLRASGNSTGTVYLQDDPEYIVEKAFSFMESISTALPICDRADEEALALAQRIRGTTKFSSIESRLIE